MLTLPGCQACDPDDLPSDVSDETAQLPEKVASQGVCSTDACLIGAHGCNDYGDVVECVADEAGCGVWGDVINQCPASHWCYQGVCEWVDAEPIPPLVDETTPSLFSLPGPHEPIPDHITVIPYSAFLNALRNDSWFESANGLLMDEAANLTAQGNRLESWGVTFEVEEVGEFYGDLFLVVMDARESRSKVAHLEAQRYFVAAMPGLAGVTAWVGKPGTRQIIRSGPLGNVSCCQPSGTQSTLFAAGEETCGVVPEGGGGGFCPMSGSLWSSPDCNPTFVPDADFRAELEEFYNTNMINWAVPSLGRTLLISSPKGVETVPMRRNGAPLVTMVATSDRGGCSRGKGATDALWTMTRG